MLGSIGCGQERLPHSELFAARARGGCEDKGRWFELEELTGRRVRLDLREVPGPQSEGTRTH